jgi:hypothetical protein
MKDFFEKRHTPGGGEKKITEKIVSKKRKIGKEKNLAG